MMISSNYNEKTNHQITGKKTLKKAPYPSPKKKGKFTPANTKNLEDCIPKRV